MLETLALIEECAEGTKGSVKGPDNKYFKLKDGVNQIATLLSKIPY
jgi:hypothetical protein